ncbi:c-type cytochrome [Iodobacter sp. CM08]|uniref:c-type cytochrome n=1 Tax=Iodobacter sp. CM08 TaxID=3085902 RepID=UPI00298233F6|nr:c-type cytochrome [Iodobacter sp. CM08]MDW5416162.1 c-type cytochrome [Iodobacter sp. CM08]
MKKVIFLFSLFIVSSAYAVAPADLAKAKNCFACHATDKKLIGPSYKDVAAKYKGDASAAGKLADKIKKGGSGVWGAMPMPPNTVSDAEAKDLAKWVLSIK